MITFNPWSWGDESYYSEELARKVLEMIAQELGGGLKMGKISYRPVNSSCPYS